MDIAILSFIGIVIGASLQYFFTRHLDSLRTHREAKTKAYTDYLRCVAENVNPSQAISLDGQDLIARKADAKCRICLYASPKVISTFAKYETLGASTKSGEQRAAFITMVQSMRSDLPRGSSVTDTDLQAVLLGND